MLQCVVSIMQCVVEYALQCVAVCCSVLQCVAVCCSVLHCVAVCVVVAVCCSVLQCFGSQRHLPMSHVAHMSQSYIKMSHVALLSHVAHTNESRRTHEYE